MRPILVTLVLLLWSLQPPAWAQDGKTYAATAHLKSAAGVEATAPVSVVVDRVSTDAERTQLLAALKKSGTDGVRELLLTWKPIGTFRAGSTNTEIKYAYERTTTSGRLITAVTGSPIMFVGAGAPGAKPRAGFDLGLVLLDVPTSGPGTGEIVPAAKIRMDEQGAIVTDDYSAEKVVLSGVAGK